MLYEELHDSVRRARLFLACFVVAILGVGYGLGALFGSGPIGLIAAAVLSVLLSWISYVNGDRVVLRLSRARLVSAQEEPRLHNIVEGLATSLGFEKPSVYVVNDVALNAFATGRDPAHAAVAVTRGLLDAMNRVELEGVIAHELSHVKNRDTLVMGMAVTLIGLPSTLFPFFAPIMRAAVGRRREFYADVNGVQLTRFPPGLISALEKLKGNHAASRALVRATEPMWIESPLRHEQTLMARLFDTHPPLDERIKVLREL